MRIKLGVPLTLSQIAKAVGGKLLKGGNEIIRHITTDSREAKSKDLFVPVLGKRFNGADFIFDATQKGCFAISPYIDRGNIFLPDFASALLDLASFYNKNLPYILYRIGITGSVGKTTTKEFLKILLSTEYKTHANEGNFNNEIGLPMSIFSAPPDTQVLLMEMGMNHKGEISRLSKCLSPDIGIITNIGSAHIGNLGSRKAIAEAKLEITDGMTDGKLLIPDNEELLFGVKNYIDVSLTNKNSTYYMKDEGNYITAFKDGHILCKSTFSLTEKHHRECLLFAVAAASESGVSPSGLNKGIPAISKHNTRQRVIFKENFIFITDFYNASFESVLASIESVKNENMSKRKSLILGDILELGKMSEEIHVKIGRSISPSHFCNLFLFGNMAKNIGNAAIENGFTNENIHINDNISRPDISAMQIKQHCKPGELILMKASRGIRLERVLDYFKE